MTSFGRPPHLMKDQRGFTTLDFAFALMISFGFAVVFFSVTITLSFVEITQYVAFATSRAYSAAHSTPDAQKDLALSKFDEITGQPMIKNLYSFGWIMIGPPSLGDFNGLEGYEQSNSSIDSATFWGARIPFEAKILNTNIPFLGRTANDSTTGKATIASYLSREVSTQECRELFNAARWLRILQLAQGVYDQATQKTSGAYLITDNGC